MLKIFLEFYITFGILIEIISSYFSYQPSNRLTLSPLPFFGKEILGCKPTQTHTISSGNTK